MGRLQRSRVRRADISAALEAAGVLIDVIVHHIEIPGAPDPRGEASTTSRVLFAALGQSEGVQLQSSLRTCWNQLEWAYRFIEDEAAPASGPPPAASPLDPRSPSIQLRSPSIQLSESVHGGRRPSSTSIDL